jgi:MFS family permease
VRAGGVGRGTDRRARRAGRGTTTTFKEGAERNKALGIWAAVGGIGATAAWLVGGPVTDGLGWEWIFFINVPVAVGVAALSPALLRESRDREHGAGSMSPAR